MDTSFDSCLSVIIGCAGHNGGIFSFETGRDNCGYTGKRSFASKRCETPFSYVWLLEVPKRCSNSAKGADGFCASQTEPLLRICRTIDRRCRGLQGRQLFTR